MAITVCQENEYYELLLIRAFLSTHPRLPIWQFVECKLSPRTSSLSKVCISWRQHHPMPPTRQVGHKQCKVLECRLAASNSSTCLPRTNPNKVVGLFPSIIRGQMDGEHCSTPVTSLLLVASIWFRWKISFKRWHAAHTTT